MCNGIYCAITGKTAVPVCFTMAQWYMKKPGIQSECRVFKKLKWFLMSFSQRKSKICGADHTGVFPQFCGFDFGNHAMGSAKAFLLGNPLQGRDQILGIF